MQKRTVESGQGNHPRGLHRTVAAGDCPRQAGKIHSGPGQAGHRPLHAVPGRLQTYRPKGRTLPKPLR